MDDPYVALERELSRLFRRAHGASNEISALAHPELDSELYTLLAYIDRHPESLAKNVAAEFRLDPGTVSRQLARAESAALIRRTPHPDDSRRMMLELTEEGREVLDAARDGRTALMRIILQGWLREDVSVFASLLERLLNLDGTWPTVTPQAASDTKNALAPSHVPKSDPSP